MNRTFCILALLATMTACAFETTAGEPTAAPLASNGESSSYGSPPAPDDFVHPCDRSEAIWIQGHLIYVPIRCVPPPSEPGDPPAELMRARADAVGGDVLPSAAPAER
jgi:hypothetical protein